MRDNLLVVSWRREPSPVAGSWLGLGLVVAVTAVVGPVEGHVTRATPALALVLPVVVAGIAGGRRAALVTALGAAAALNLAFIPPHWTLKIDSVDDGVAFTVFVVVALVVGTLVAREADRRRAAEQRSAEIEALYRRYEQVVEERERLMEEAHHVALLRQLDDQRKALLRSVSHDLRTPLAVIRAATSDIRAGADYDDATRDELLDLVGDEAERLDRLVNNLLSMSSIEAGSFEPERQAVAVDELVADRIHRLSRLFRRVKVKDVVPAGLPLVDADYSQMDQVLTNLLENAARHSPAGGAIEVGARALESDVEVWVRDEGPGVDVDHREELFEPFRRGPGSQSSGIGLAICRAIIDAHGGHIDVRNEPSGGALFFFTVPVHGG